jgi:hypothetical protein
MVLLVAESERERAIKLGENVRPAIQVALEEGPRIRTNEWRTGASVESAIDDAGLGRRGRGALAHVSLLQEAQSDAQSRVTPCLAWTETRTAHDESHTRERPTQLAKVVQASNTEYLRQARSRQTG